MRNTDGTDSLKRRRVRRPTTASSSSPHLDGTVAGFDTLRVRRVADDPATVGCDENAAAAADAGRHHPVPRRPTRVDAPGINKQAVYNGTAEGRPRVGAATATTPSGAWSGKDVIEGGGGIDNALGGDGDDVITDLSGADVLKGGPGNDAVNGGPDNDLVLGGDGQDFLNGGANDNQVFGGPDNDFVIGGQGADAVLGDGGDDWIEGGPGQDLLTGDHGAPFFDDPGQVAPGNEVLIGQGGDDYVAEGGDDVMASNAAPIDTFIGSAGFDWADPPVRHRRPPTTT